MGENEKKALKAIQGVLTVASSNFPGSTDIEISTRGRGGSASVTVPYYVLSNLIKEEPTYD